MYIHSAFTLKELKLIDPIVITGLGAITPLGVGVENVWKRLIAGQSGIKNNNRFDTENWKCQIAGLVPDKENDEFGFNPLDFMESKDVRRNDLFIQFAIGAAFEAINQAQWFPKDDYEKSRTATIIATGVGGVPAIANATQTVAKDGVRSLSPFIVPSFLPNLASGQIAIKYGYNGPSGAPVTACAASAQAIGDAMRLINNNEIDIAICGGAEACVDPVSIGGFTSAKALSFGYNETPTNASRPFDNKHDGFVLSEGAAILVIEKLSHALKRGAKPIAKITGYGTTTDAYHVTSGWPDGREAARAMQIALKMANLSPSQIDYINAHATSTPVGDSAEIAAIKKVFGENDKVAISSTKSSTGHMLGAAGAIEAIFSALSIRDQILPTNLNLQTPIDTAANLNLVTGAPKKALINNVLSNAFGFGGVNAALVFSRCD